MQKCKIRHFTRDDIVLVTPMHINYFNGFENG